jgi:hypothetical protein
MIRLMNITSDREAVHQTPGFLPLESPFLIAKPYVQIHLSRLKNDLDRQHVMENGGMNPEISN